MARATKYLIVNADDFGQSKGVNEGIIRCFEHGIVSSTSMMVRWPAFDEAAAYARSHRELCMGIHVDLGEWMRPGRDWIAVYEVVDLSDADAVKAEVWSQIEAFREAVGHKPTHIDSHQHVHLRKSVAPVISAIAEELAVPLRHATPGITYNGDFYGQSDKGYAFPEGVSLEHLESLLVSIVAPVTEMACHPGIDVSSNTMYRRERDWEVRALTDKRLPRLLESLGIQLYSFREFTSESQRNAETRQ